MGCLKLTYRNETETRFCEVWKHGEGEKELKDHYDYGFRIYNPAIGRFLSVDPLTKSYPMLTPYQFAGDEPISSIDIDGLERYKVGKDGKLEFYCPPDATTQIHNPAPIKKETSSPKITLPTQENTFLSDSPESGISAEGKRKLYNIRQYETTIAEGQKRGQAIQPLLFGGSGNNPFGTGKTLRTAVAEDPYVVLPEMGLAKLAELKHLAKFSKGASHLTTTKRLSQFSSSPNFGGPNGLFIAATAEIDALLAKGVTRAEIEVALGLEEGALQGGKLVKIDITNPSKFNLRLPTKGNSNFIPGGKTSGGVSEAIVDPIEKGTEGVTKTVLEGF